MMNAVELSGVTKKFGRHVAVDNLDLVVPEGAVYGFIGPNGSGKTTTLRMMLRIFYPDRGTVRVLGLEHGAAADDRIGYLPEERGLYKKMRLRDVLQFHAELKGRSRCRGAIDDWLARMDLTDWAEKRVETLSKGMSQKVQFIAAVIAQPQLLILDEPFSGLDPVNMETLKDVVLEQKKQGTTVIFSTHDMEVAERMCDTIFMIFRGRKVLDGTLAAIQNQYGEDTIRVRTETGNGALENLPGVIRVNDYGRDQELRIVPGTDSQAVLTELARRTRIERFELARPSLHDIFVRIAGPQAAGPQAAGPQAAGPQAAGPQATESQEADGQGVSHA
jgi:ABC-2 type transport system ATP-binding protein